MAKISDKRRQELKAVALGLTKSTLSASSLEDVVSICATVARGTEFVPAEELTIDEGSVVEEELNELLAPAV